MGVKPVMWLLNLVPGIATADSTRYSGPAVNFAIFVLVVFSFDDYERLPSLDRKRLGVLGLSLVALTMAAILPASDFIRAWDGARPEDMLIAIAAAIFTLLVLTFLSAELLKPRARLMLVAWLLALPLVTTIVPQFAGLRGGRIDMAPIRYLQAHIGTSRIASTGPFNYNFPSRYHIATVNYNALPAPLAWTTFVHARLSARSDLNSFDNAAWERASLAHLPAYEAMGVRYIVAPPGDDIAAKRFVVADAAQRDAAHALLAGSSIVGTIPATLPFQSIGALSIVIGTYRGAATGSLVATLCAGPGNCVHATADVGTTQDNAPMLLTFAKPLSAAGKALTFRFEHPDGRPVALWFAPTADGSEKPAMDLFSSTPGLVQKRVFHDQNASIFELRDPAPFVWADHPSCVVRSQTWRRINAICVSQFPDAAGVVSSRLVSPGQRRSDEGLPNRAVPAPCAAGRRRHNNVQLCTTPYRASLLNRRPRAGTVDRLRRPGLGPQRKATSPPSQPRT